MSTTLGTAGAEVRHGTRSGVIGLLGAVVNGACGFVLTVVVVRLFGPAEAGEFFTAVALVTIVGSLCCLGTDSGLVWALPRRTLGATGDAARLLPLALLPTAVLAAAVGAGGVIAAPALAGVLLDGDPGSTTTIRIAFAGVPVFVVATILLAAVRATRTIRVYAGLNLVFVPIARPLLIGAVVVAGWSVVQGFAGWLLPLGLAAVGAGLLLIRPLGLTSGADLRPTPDDRRLFWSFALPRVLSAAIDAGSMWIGVLLTSALAGQADAGIFAAVGRCALAGLLIMHGLRVAVGPQLSRLLGAGRRREAAQIYRRTTLAIVLLSWPVYLLLAAFAPALVTLFGAEFTGVSAPMAVLALAMLVNAGVGLVQTVLLMNGDSRGHLLAAGCGLLLNVGLCVLLVPRHGALGAAIAWSIGIIGENLIAAFLARRALGEALFDRVLAGVAATTVAVTGCAATVGVLLGGRGLSGLGITLGLLTLAALASLGNGRVRQALQGFRDQLRPATNQEVSR